MEILNVLVSEQAEPFVKVIKEYNNPDGNLIDFEVIPVNFGVLYSSLAISGKQAQDKGPEHFKEWSEQSLVILQVKENEVNE